MTPSFDGHINSKWIIWVRAMNARRNLFSNDAPHAAPSRPKLSVSWKLGSTVNNVWRDFLPSKRRYNDPIDDFQPWTLSIPAAASPSLRRRGIKVRFKLWGMSTVPEESCTFANGMETKELVTTSKLDLIVNQTCPRLRKGLHQIETEVIISNGARKQGQVRSMQSLLWMYITANIYLSL